MTGLPGSDQRLAQGIEVLDVIRGGRVARPVRVDLEGRWAPRGLTPHSPYARPTGRRERPGVSRHASCLHVLLYHPALFALPPEERHVTIRLHDHMRWFVPRRLRLPLIDPQTIESDVLDLPLEHRIRRLSVFPGAAYECSERATGLRGLVLRDGAPVAWARIEARYPGFDNLLAGRAHGDDRGEFLLLLGGHPAPFGVPNHTIEVQLRIYGPPAPPDPARDALATLPIEALPAPGAPDLVSSGELSPEGYQAAPPTSISLRLGRITSALPPFQLP